MTDDASLQQQQQRVTERTVL